jgi:hypothetical protein
VDVIAASDVTATNKIVAGINDVTGAEEVTAEG